MLLYLDESLKNLKDENEIKKLFFNLARHYRDNNHLIYGDTNLLRNIRNKHFNNEIDTFIDFIIDKERHLLPVIDSLLIQINICDKQTVKKNINNKKEYRYFDYNYFLRPDMYNKSELVCENLTDCNFYLNATNYFLRKKYNQKLNFNIRKILGGGSTTNKVVKDVINEKHFCLCIVESDLKYPDDTQGKTADNVDNIPDSVMLKKLILKINEMENLVPLSLLNNISGSKCEQKGILNFLCKLHDEEKCKDKEKHCLYIDLKKGFKLDSKSISNQNLFNYWQNKLNLNIDDVNNDLKNGIEYLKFEDKPLLGYGNSNIKHKIDSILESNDLKKIENNLDYTSVADCVKEVLEDIADWIYSFGCNFIEPYVI